jgi:Peptidase_C39 like family
MSRRRGGSAATRWLLHGAVLGSLAPLLVGLIGPNRFSSGDVVRSLKESVQQPYVSTRLLEWLPARNPPRTGPPRDPSPPLFRSLNLPVAPAPASATQPALPRVTWVQTHREAGLFAGPGEGAPRFTILPQWSYLKVLDSKPGWLLVRFEGDGSRGAGEAWVSAGAVGPIDSPRWLTNRRDTALYAGPERDAPLYTRLPAWSVLEALDKDEAERTLVRYAGDGNTRQAGEAWVHRADLELAHAPPGSLVPWGAVLGSAGDEARLAVPYRSQLDGSRFAVTNCGPSSVGMALEAFGVFASTDDLRYLANRLQGTWSANEGVKIEVLHAMVERYDLRGLDLERPEGGFRRWTIEDVQRHLRAGHPVIPQLRYRLLPGHERELVGWDHYVVLTGFSGDTIYYHDSARLGPYGSHQAISADALVRAWSASDYPFAAFAIAK